jgi:hypothetical protein
MKSSCFRKDRFSFKRKLSLFRKMVCRLTPMKKFINDPKNKKTHPPAGRRVVIAFSFEHRTLSGNN